MRAILAVKMLAISDDALLAKLEKYIEGMKDKVIAKDEKLNSEGRKAMLDK